MWVGAHKKSKFIEFCAKSTFSELKSRGAAPGRQFAQFEVKRMQQTFQTNRLILCIQKVSLKTLRRWCWKRRLRIRPSLAIYSLMAPIQVSSLAQPAHKIKRECESFRFHFKSEAAAAGVYISSLHNFQYPGILYWARGRHPGVKNVSRRWRGEKD